MMKRLFVLYSTILLCVILGIGWIFQFPSHAMFREPQPDSSKELSSIAAVSPIGAVREMLEQVNKDRALDDLRRLSGEMPICTDKGCYTITNRLTGSEGLHWAKEYLSTTLIKLGYSVKFQDWIRSDYSDQDIIVRKPGLELPGEEIYFVAHIDGVKNSGGDRFPAADDNASGVVDILELARVLSSHSFSRTLVLFFATGEEQGTLGVQSYLSQLTSQELSSIKYVVNVDMIGYDGNHDEGMELWYGDHSPSLTLAQNMSEIIKAYQLDLSPGFVVGCG